MRRSPWPIKQRAPTISSFQNIIEDMELPNVGDTTTFTIDHSPTPATIASLPLEIFDLILHHAAGPVLSLSDGVCEARFSVISADRKSVV